MKLKAHLRLWTMDEPAEKVLYQFKYSGYDADTLCRVHGQYADKSIRYPPTKNQKGVYPLRTEKQVFHFNNDN